MASAPVTGGVSCVLNVEDRFPEEGNIAETSCHGGNRNPDGCQGLP